MADPFTRSIVVLASLDDVYQIWANFENFPRFMKYIKSVTLTGDRTSHWVMTGPLGVDIEWDAETTRRDENERVAWNSKDNSPVKTSGQVQFRQVGPNETEVTVTLTYEPPAGVAGDALAAIFANPEKRVMDDLEHFKAHVESTSLRIHTRTEAK
ncbi:MAG: SRPBCC family protein [Anaerolineales bacterium]